VTRIGAHTLRGDTTPRITGSVVNWIGDSIAPPAQTSPGFGPRSAGVYLFPSDFLAWAHLLSNGRILFGKAAGLSGQIASQMMARIDTDVLAWGGNWCGITTGTNDATNGVTPNQFAANIRNMCAAIVSRGQIPILTTLVPQPAQSTLIDQYRRFQIAYAADNGWPLVDWYSKLVDPASATNAYLSTYDSGDGYHPNNLGRRVMGQALVDALTPYLPPWTSPVQTANGTANANLLTNSQFVTDTNSDGTPDGWSKSGPGTVSLVTDGSINGKALRLVDSAGGGTLVLSSGISGSFGGHRLAFTGKIKNPGTGAMSLQLALSSGVNVFPAYSWTEPFSGWQSFYLEIVAPAGTTSLGLALVSGTGATGVDVSVGQLGIFDLTACGI